MAVGNAYTRLYSRLGFCSEIGAFVGVLAGLMFGLVQTQVSGSFSVEDALRVAVLLSLVTILFGLLLFGVWERYGVGAVLIPVVLIGLLTTVLTVLLLNAAGLTPVPELVGVVVGIVVGRVVCYYRCGGLRYQESRGIASLVERRGDR